MSFRIIEHLSNLHRSPVVASAHLGQGVGGTR
jgi:hypothetical protein